MFGGSGGSGPTLAEPIDLDLVREFRWRSDKDGPFCRGKSMLRSGGQSGCRWLRRAQGRRYSCLTLMDQIQRFSRAVAVCKDWVVRCDTTILTCKQAVQAEGLSKAVPNYLRAATSRVAAEGQRSSFYFIYPFISESIFWDDKTKKRVFICSVALEEAYLISLLDADSKLAG